MIKIDGGKPSKDTRILLDDKRMISYRPRLNSHTGSVTATIMLCQAMYWATHFCNPFWKFMQPCDHAQYKKGDSWMEELGFTRTEMETALKRLGQKIQRKTTEIDKEAYIWYWTDMSRLTWYQINWERVNLAMAEAYEDVMQETDNTYCRNPEIRNSGILKQVMQESGFRYKEQRIPETTHKVSSSVDLDGMDGNADDDDLFRDLLDLGLSPTLAKGVLEKNERILVQAKLKDMLVALKNGRVSNMTGYAMKVFSRELYSPVQAAKIFNTEKSRGKQRKAEGIEKQREEEKEIELPEMGAEQLAGWERHIYGNKVLWKIYRERGTGSPMVRASMKIYIDQAINKGERP